MVHFGLKLEHNRVSIWTSSYVDYQGLKAEINRLSRAKDEKQRVHSGQLPTTESSKLLSADLSKSTSGVVAFEGIVRQEVTKVEGFYLMKLSEIQNEMDRTMRAPDGTEQDSQPVDKEMGEELEKKTIPGPRRHTLKNKNLIVEDSVRRTLLKMFRELNLLECFALLNYTAFIKVAKRFDKHLNISSESGSMSVRVAKIINEQCFHTRVELRELMDRCAQEFANRFCDGNRNEAKGIMLLQHQGDENIDLGQFLLGYRMGVAAVLVFWVMWDSVIEVWNMPSNHYSFLAQPAFQVYRAVAGILTLRWCWGISCLVWGRARINYIYLFQLDPRGVSTPIDIFNNTAGETIFFFANMLMFYKLQLGHFPQWVPAGYLPLALCIFVVYKMVYPWHRAREVWTVVGKVLCAPLFKVDFFSTYVADVMTSSVKTTQDVAWTFCYFLSGDFLLSRDDFNAHGGSWQQSSLYTSIIIPALCVAPLWLRFQQCLRRYYHTSNRFPHLANALKYSMALTVALFGVLAPQDETRTVRIVWITMYVISTLYTFWWDVRQDWGLGRREDGFLHKRRMYSRPAVYYSAVVVDLILRFNWLYSLIPPGHLPLFASWSHSTRPAFVTTFVIACEFLRRTMWGLFRLENEHLNNTEGYFNSSEVVPLHFITGTTSMEPTRRGLAAIGEVVGFGAIGIVSATAAIVVARNQPS